MRAHARTRAQARLRALARFWARPALLLSTLLVLGCSSPAEPEVLPLCHTDTLAILSYRFAGDYLTNFLAIARLQGYSCTLTASFEHPLVAEATVFILTAEVWDCRREICPDA